jgi:hypothetical protein
VWKSSEDVKKIAALPSAVRKGSALPDLRLKIKLFGFSRLPESRRLSAQQAAEPQDLATSDFFTASQSFRAAGKKNQ